MEAKKDIDLTQERCHHCGKVPTSEMLAKNPFCPWYETRIGPAAAWHRCYCSEECASHAEEYSREDWKKLRAASLQTREYVVSYYEPGLGWCRWIDPYPEGTVYRHFDQALAAANKCREDVDRSVRVWRWGALVHEIRRIDPKTGKVENLPEA